MVPGIFLSVDGLDGTGKSTQSRLLAERLRSDGHTVTTCVDPGGTELGTKLREILLFGRQYSMCLRTEMLLFMASRVELVEQIIRPALGQGQIVISDRFLLANVVYQGHAGGLDIDELWKIGRFATQGIEPEFTIVFDLPVDVAAQRRDGLADRVESRGDAYHKRVRAGFLHEANRRPERYEVIDASPAVDEVHEVVWERVKRFLESRKISRTHSG